MCKKLNASDLKNLCSCVEILQREIAWKIGEESKFECSHHVTSQNIYTVPQNQNMDTWFSSSWASPTCWYSRSNFRKGSLQVSTICTRCFRFLIGVPFKDIIWQQYTCKHFLIKIVRRKSTFSKKFRGSPLCSQCLHNQY
mgnify:CR=1 FL=1